MSELEKNTIEKLIGKTNNKGGFTAPDAYFDGMKNAILSKIDGDKLTIDTPQTGFIAPDTFFEEQKHQILAMVNKPQAKRIKLNSYQWLIRAASIAAMLTIVGFLFLNKNASKSVELTASISSEEIVNHLEKNDVSEELICELIDQNKVTKKETDLEKYLNEHADEDLLIDEL